MLSEALHVDASADGGKEFAATGAAGNVVVDEADELVDGEAVAGASGGEGAGQAGLDEVGDGLGVGGADVGVRGGKVSGWVGERKELEGEVFWVVGDHLVVFGEAGAVGLALLAEAVSLNAEAEVLVAGEAGEDGVGVGRLAEVVAED